MKVVAGNVQSTVINSHGNSRFSTLASQQSSRHPRLSNPCAFVVEHMYHEPGRITQPHPV
jgi:hypothetical protein